MLKQACSFLLLLYESCINFWTAHGVLGTDCIASIRVYNANELWVDEYGEEYGRGLLENFLRIRQERLKKTTQIKEPRPRF
jgi:hypothetical protein